MTTDEIKIRNLNLLKELVALDKFSVFREIINSKNNGLSEKETKVLKKYSEEKKFEEILFFLDLLIDNLQSTIGSINNPTEASYDENFLIPIKKGEKWGFCNRNKNIIIDCKFDAVSKFKEDIAIYKIGNKSGLLNKSGISILSLISTSIYSFFDGKAIVSQKVENLEKYGAINIQGDTIIEPKFNYLKRFSEGLSMAKLEVEDKFGFINFNGEFTINCHFEKFNDPQFELFEIGWYEEGYIFKEGLCKVATGRYNEIGFINSSGDEIIPFGKYSTLNTFSEGFSAVGIKNQSQKTLFGFIDKVGNEVIECQYDLVSSFSEGLAIAVKEGKHGYINRKGEIIIPFLYDWAMPFSGGIAAVYLNISAKTNAKKFRWGYIEKTGKTIIPFIYEGNHTLYEQIPTKSPLKEGLILSKKNGKYGYIDRHNNTIIPFKYTIASDFENGLANVSDEIDWYRKAGFYIDTEGNEYK